MTTLPFRSLLARPQPVDIYAKRVTRGGGQENSRGEFVLYWAQSARRLSQNIALNYAIDKSNAARLPVVVYESLRPDYPSANDRIHSFVLEGVADNVADAARRGLRYHFFLPRTRDAARGVVLGLASRARIIVTDEFPTFVVRDQTRRLMATSPVAVHAVDGNGVFPMRAFEKEQYSAKFLRDGARKTVVEYWSPIAERAPRHFFDGDIDVPLFSGAPRPSAAECDIDHSIKPVAIKGGRVAALDRLQKLTGRESGLSPYLHFGYIGIHEIVEHVLAGALSDEAVDEFLEQAVIRRELSFNMCFCRNDHDSLAVLPDWARQTLDKHRHDRRSPQYGYDELDAACTHDEVWNYAHRQLVETGTMHNYLRMLWGKKIIEWSPSPEDAHAAMILFFEKYALDGRDPNTHAGVLWCFGKHDRPWFPERPIFGTVRYMSSDATARKLRLRSLLTASEATARTLAMF